MKTALEMRRYQKKSQSQWVKAKRMNPPKPKMFEVATSAEPIVAHHKKKYGFAPVAATPDTTEENFTSPPPNLTSSLTLNICKPIIPSIKPPAKPIPLLTISYVNRWEKPR